MAMMLAEHCDILSVELAVPTMSLTGSCMHCSQCHHAHAALITRCIPYLLD